MSLDLAEETREIVILKENIDVLNSGPTQSTLGHVGVMHTKKVRNAKGGKNPQAAKKGKENKPNKKVLGPRTKQFSPKIAKGPMGRMEGQSIEIGNQLGLAQFQNIKTSTPLKIRITKSSGGSPSTRTSSDKEMALNKKTGKEGMDWKGIKDVGDAEVLRDLHAGIKLFAKGIITEGDGVGLTNIGSTQKPAVPMPQSVSKEGQNSVSGDVKGSGSAQSKEVSP